MLMLLQFHSFLTCSTDKSYQTPRELEIKRTKEQKVENWLRISLQSYVFELVGPIILTC